MTGKLYIDNKDAYLEFGVFITEGGFDELLAFPPLKEVESNNWPEEDGVEVDLSHPVLNTRDVSIKFAAHAMPRVGRFLEFLSNGAYHTFDFRKIGRTFTLRFISQSAGTKGRLTETFALNFADDFPKSETYTYLPPASGAAAPTGYWLNDRELSEYGICVLQGSDEEILKSPAVKPNLVQNSKAQHGALYDDGPVWFQSKEVKIRCLMRARTLAGFWRNYDALLHDLTRPGERTLHVDRTIESYSYYYKSASTRVFAPESLWFEFDLTLVFTSFRRKDEQYLLVSEQGELICTEDGIHAIDIEK